MSELLLHYFELPDLIGGTIHISHLNNHNGYLYVDYNLSIENIDEIKIYYATYDIMSRLWEQIRIFGLILLNQVHHIPTDQVLRNPSHELYQTYLSNLYYYVMNSCNIIIDYCIFKLGINNSVRASIFTHKPRTDIRLLRLDNIIRLEY